MNALWKVGEFRSSHTPEKIVLCLAKDQGEIERYEKHESFVRWVYAHYTANSADTLDLAGRLSSAVALDEQDEGCDISAGLYGVHASNLLREVGGFKTYVHQRLDAMGVPPESEHEVGGRLDWVEKNLRQIADLALIELTASPAQPSGFVLAPRDWFFGAQEFIARFTSGNSVPREVRAIAVKAGPTIAQEATHLRDLLTAAPAPIEQEG